MSNRLIIVLYQALMSFYWPLPALIAIERGLGPRFIGFIVTLNTLCQLASSLFWPRYALFSNRTKTISLGFFGILAGAVLLHFRSTLIPAVVVLSILPGAAYYSLLNQVRNDVGSLSGNISKFLKNDSIGRLIGLLIGTLSSYFMGASQMPLLLFLLTFFIMLVVAGLGGEGGLLEIIDGSILEMKSIRRDIRNGQLKMVVSSMDLKTSTLPYLATSGLFSLGLSLMMPQIPTILEGLFGSASLFYIMSMLSRITMIFAYRLTDHLSPLPTAYFVRLSMYAFLFLSIVSRWAIIPFFIMSGAGLSFLLTFYSKRNLKAGSGMISLNLTSRLLCYSVGSSLSGLIFESFGILGAGIASMAVFMLAPLPMIVSEKVLKR